MDPENPVVKLCAEGMQAEMEGRPDDARDLFMRAWDRATDDYEACIAAHYVARHQETPEETLRWNLEALNRAEAVDDGRIDGFRPSLYLNMGWSHEVLGDRAEAARYYTLAEKEVAGLPANGYGALVRGGIAEGRKRVGADRGELSRRNGA
ncbi:MAG: hypothetical protein JWQ98_3356 [Chlorobi bacterium]|jgi:hypothetical protein|nr:hypothetical protein [Chlorobiota bacterium]